MAETQSVELARNVKRIGHLDIPGGGQVVVQDGFAYVGHMKPPHGTSIIDVSDPAKPKVAASIISFPILTALFDLIGILGGYVSGCVIMGVNSGSYFYRVVSSVGIEDVNGGFIKSLVFAVIVSTICCYQGYFTHMRTDSYGARSVSLSTTSAVVLSCVSILVADYIVTSFLL